ncbi:flagellar assembly protein FliH [Massilia sp. PAMC28688]|nr:flagellar assembly protein FliH [Massilia sp. PAMC28688]
MNSFGDDRPSALAKRAPPPPEPPSEAELEALREQARLQGHDQGVQAGYAEGLAIGRAEAQVELEHLKTVAQSFSGALAQADQAIATDVLELALQLAKGMLRTALEVKPELIIPLVREAVGYLPVVQQPATLLLHPLDADIVKEGIGEDLEKSGWRIVEDSHIERGGCKVDTASNQIDAQASSRWQRLANSLGRNDVEWLA